ncbi:ferrochelatase [Shewanella sp. JM162201]|uniref:Ferrochelatase n=1 Tax=Shewanella jiangmenensis TaxID=2837387 RepID=A0ABS5UYC4_9GAMM|nr:ferrochelatase [Shewanella jiangmenensis]MBT1443107.1 ferrochelatase [Shewanella jiangmenensis]
MFGVLLVNLGTPDAPDASSVRRFLKQFLSDPRVVDLSPWIWKPLLNGVILNTRPAKVAKLYQSIWWDEGSPLMVISKRQREKLAAELKTLCGFEVPVALGMSYGSPSLSDGLDSLTAQGVDNIVVLPLYPQYSCSTVASVFDGVAGVLKSRRRLPEWRMVREYYRHPLYIRALAASVTRLWDIKGKPDRLLMSFHGVPLRYINEGDPYQAQCLETARLVAKELKLGNDEWQVCFQSRFGKEEWLTPYTDELLESLPGQGVKRVDIMCPAFAADCLETLEEIAEGGQESFLHAGGEQYRVIPCLNDDDDHIRLLAELVREQSLGWQLG